MNNQDKFLKLVEKKYGYEAWDYISSILFFGKSIKMATWLKCLKVFQKHSPRWFDQDMAEVTLDDTLLVDLCLYEETGNLLIKQTINVFDLANLLTEMVIHHHPYYLDIDIYIK
jgi:hypothetical protein